MRAFELLEEGTTYAEQRAKLAHIPQLVPAVDVYKRQAQGRGRRGIAAELENLGIDADGVEALAAADADAGEVDRALALLDRKPPRAKNRRCLLYTSRCV